MKKEEGRELPKKVTKKEVVKNELNPEESTNSNKKEEKK